MKLNSSSAKAFLKITFAEELRSSGEIESGFSVEFGRYNMDSDPVIGELLDINAWDRSWKP